MSLRYAISRAKANDRRQKAKLAKNKYRLQHEFDNEPTYIVDKSNTDEPIVTVAPGHYDYALRICELLNQLERENHD